MPTKADYEAAFEAERRNSYREIDVYESNMGFAVSRLRLEQAARVLACPVKVNPPNWQHGRVIYSTVRAYLRDKPFEHFTMLDIGTAKGFSALCMVWALTDSARRGSIFSVDVINPKLPYRRNTIAEVDGLKTLAEMLEPWPEAAHVTFQQAAGVDWLALRDERIHFAFVDGKHSFEAVSREAELLRDRQESGDIIVFDDLQIPGVERGASQALSPTYNLAMLEAKPERRYGIAVKR